jgi:hypothetical protein
MDQTNRNNLNDEKAPKRGLLSRVITSLRHKIRRLLKKEDPNIYPFY